jgi:hypothetical protein
LRVEGAVGATNLKEATVEEQDRIETEETDVEGHKLEQRLSQKLSHARGDEPEQEGEASDVEGHKLSHARGDEPEQEGEEPDVEAHKLANQVSPKLDI